MGASSVTGRSGPGDSRGKYKPDLHCGGCSCGCQGDDCNPTVVKPRVVCAVRNRSGGGIAIRANNAAISVKGC